MMARPAGKRRRGRRDASRRRLGSTTPAWIESASGGPDDVGASTGGDREHRDDRDRDAAHGGGQGPPRGPDVADAPSGRRMVGGRDLPVAIAVGLALLALVGGALWWHPWAFVAVIGLLTSVAYFDVRRVLQSVELSLDVGVASVATLVMLVGAMQARQTGQLVGILVLIVGSFVWHLADPVRHRVVSSVGLTVMFGLWVGYLASHAVLLVGRPDGGIELIIAVVGAAVLMDTGGYVVGVALGRRPVAPSISPNKTWEGLAGGMVVVGVAGALGLPLLDGSFDVVTGLVVALACGLAAFVGDLAESMVKRDLGVKDLGRVLPGHGGILDRVDGILWALPVGYYAVELLGV